MSKEAMKLALEALKELVAQTETGLFAVRHDHVAMQDARQAITALREALAEQPAQQEYERGFVDGMQRQAQSSVDKAVNAMSQRTWVGLTDEEIFEIHKQVDSMQYLTFGHAIEAKLKEKNT
jgi:hypothetical protein